MVRYPTLEPTTGTQVTYGALPAQARESGRNRMAYLVRLGTLGFWVPAIGIDLVALRHGGFAPEIMGFVFWLLFREAVVFLALWFTFGLVQALMFGWRSRDPRLPKRSRKPAVSNVLLPNREHKVH